MSVFEEAVERSLGDWIRETFENGAEMWSALANIIWEHPEHGEDAHSFRSAGALVARIHYRDIGHPDPEWAYVDFYCSGPYGSVSDHVAQKMAAEGWTWRRYP